MSSAHGFPVFLQGRVFGPWWAAQPGRGLGTLPLTGVSWDHSPPGRDRFLCQEGPWYVESCASKQGVPGSPPLQGGPGFSGAPPPRGIGSRVGMCQVPFFFQEGLMMSPVPSYPHPIIACLPGADCGAQIPLLPRANPGFLALFLHSGLGTGLSGAKFSTRPPSGGPGVLSPLKQVLPTQPGRAGVPWPRSSWEVAR